MIEVRGYLSDPENDDRSRNFVWLFKCYHDFGLHLEAELLEGLTVIISKVKSID